MRDTNWELISGDDANEIEVLNLANQANVIEAVVRFYNHHKGDGANGCKVPPDMGILKEFHRTATFLLLQNPGEFRKGQVHVANKKTGEVAYLPPKADEVRAHLTKFFEELDERWSVERHLNVGAFALWGINWIHPFKNGNGRTARALAYACISLKLGFVLSGSPTIVDLILQNQAEYYAALRSADLGYENLGKPDLVPLTAMLQRLLIQQLETIPAGPPNDE
jgi:Fic family protein